MVAGSLTVQGIGRASLPVWHSSAQLLEPFSEVRVLRASRLPCKGSVGDGLARSICACCYLLVFRGWWELTLFGWSSRAGNVIVVCFEGFMGKVTAGASCSRVCGCGLWFAGNPGTVSGRKDESLRG